MDRYIRLDHINSGGFGSVHEAISKVSGRKVAIKEAKDRVITVEEDGSLRKHNPFDQLKKEIICLKACKEHPNIVQMLDSHVDDDEKYAFIVMEQALFSLENMLKQPKNDKGLPYEVILDLIQDYNNGIEHFKRIKLAHRDIKTHNTLVFKSSNSNRRTNYLFKFCDFGLSEIVKTDDQLLLSHVGTMAFRNNALVVAEEINMWAVATTLFYVCTGRNAFRCHKEQHAKVVQEREKGQICYDEDQGYQTFFDMKQHPRWFELAMNSLIVTLLDSPTYDLFHKMSKTLCSIKEDFFLLLGHEYPIKYVDMNNQKHFKIDENEKSLSEILNIAPTKKAILIEEHRIRVVSNADGISNGSPIFVLPQVFVDNPSINLTAEFLENKFDFKTGVKNNCEDWDELMYYAHKLSKESRDLVELFRLSKKVLDGCQTRLSSEASNYIDKLNQFQSFISRIRPLVNPDMAIDNQVENCRNKLSKIVKTLSTPVNSKEVFTNSTMFLEELEECFKDKDEEEKGEARFIYAKTLYGQLHEERQQCGWATMKNNTIFKNQVILLWDNNNNLISGVKSYNSLTENFHNNLGESMSENDSTNLNLALQMTERILKLGPSDTE